MINRCPSAVIDDISEYCWSMNIPILFEEDTFLLMFGMKVLVLSLTIPSKKEHEELFHSLCRVRRRKYATSINRAWIQEMQHLLPLLKKYLCSETDPRRIVKEKSSRWVKFRSYVTNCSFFSLSLLPRGFGTFYQVFLFIQSKIICLSWKYFFTNHVGINVGL